MLQLSLKMKLFADTDFYFRYLDNNDIKTIDKDAFAGLGNLTFLCVLSHSCAY